MCSLYCMIAVLTLVNTSKLFVTADDVCGLGCHTVKSERISDTEDDATITAKCPVGEVMTGCSSYSPGSGHGKRDGEYFGEDDNGNTVCVAINGGYGTGVYAYARCCNWPNMKCEYVKGNTSTSAEDDGSFAVCPHKINCMEAMVTGCSVKSAWKHLSGVKPVMPDMCQGYNEGGSKGVIAFAACCSAPGLECKRIASVKSGGDVGDTTKVKCQEGFTMTGCNARSPWLVIDGAYIDEDDNCVAFNGGNEKGVWAVANCCK
ncbi:proprotein convertase subtilisin/kexin type 9-like [Saccoglossus kowalevskii]